MPGGSGMPMSATSHPTKYAVAIRFGILGDEEVERMSVGEIHNDNCVDRQHRPAPDGIHDPKMGTMDQDTLCGTCGCSYADCPGHFGHINLAQPVFHPGYITTIMKILRCICCECGRLRIRDKELKARIARKSSARTRFKKIFEACSKIRACEQKKEADGDDFEIGCGQIQPKYTREGLTIIRDGRDDAGRGQATMAHGDPRNIFKAKDVIKVFQKIPADELRLMGMDPERSRPEWMIIRKLTVAPPPVRPSVEEGGGARSNDDLTVAYTQIIRKNNELMRMEGRPPDRMQQDVLSNLQMLVATLMDNNQPDLPKQRLSGGRPIKCVRSRLKGKEGRVRGNLMGKRVDFSARTVITPDPILQLDQLGVPELIATNLTVPEHVTRQNLEQMRRLVTNGPNQWPGAKYIIRRDGKQIDLANKKNRADAHLDTGYIVERHLRDNDYVVFNRQPSLHKMSLMGHRVKVLPFQTFRLNLSVTSPYNADFDGDEMNMHVPQSYETKAEVKEIMAVPKQVVAPKDNKPVMGIVQDSLLGIMLLTLRDTFIELDRFMNLMMWLDYDGKLPPPAILKPRPLWTGKQLFSLVIPEVNLAKFAGKTWCCPKDANILVKNGELLCGVMNKKIVGASPGGLVHITWRDLGPEACRDFLSNTQNIVNNWLVENGFSVGVQDIVPKSRAAGQIEKALRKYKRKVQRIIQKTQRGQLETLPGKAMLESFEAEVNGCLRAALDTAGALAHKHLESFNRLSNMVTSGSKGSPLNISQIMACCGQQNVEGKRIPFGFNRRTLPHFSKDDYGPESKGFVSNCYFFGLTPQEFYFHAMGGREGLIDTACKTAETGYIQRRLIKALEDVQVKYDQTVRTARDQVLQFIYGEDGMAAEYIENMSIPLLKMSNSDMEKKFQIFRPDQDAAEKRAQLKEFIRDRDVDNIEDIDGMADKLQQEFEQLEVDREALRSVIIRGGEDEVHLPVNVPRLLKTAKEKFRIKSRGKTDLTPGYAFDELSALLDSQNANGIKVYQEPRLNSSPLFVEGNENATWLTKIYLRTMLSAKHVVCQERLSKKSFDWLLGEIKARYERSIVHPGEMVGSIGAQSMGEPATQMTLNTFHMAGVASKNVTLGVPRLKEVINVAKTIKTPSLRIFLQAPYRKDKEVASHVGNQIEHANLGHVVASSAIYYDPDPRKTIIEADEQLLEFHNEYGVAVADAQDAGPKSPWLLRFVLDNSKISGRGISIEEIHEAILAALPRDGDGGPEIIRNYDHEPLEKPVLRLRLGELEGEDEKTVPMLLREAEAHLLTELTLKGLPAVTKVSYSSAAPQCKIDVFDPVTGAHREDADNWIIETDGVALKKVLAVDKVDHKLTTSNDVIEILTTLGIEAARLSLIAELRFVLNSYGIYVNYRHLSTLCDIMTTRGILTAITRHGINRVDSGALRKCSFEETVEILLEASFHAEVDPLCGVTENIIMGQLAPYGTGCFDVMMDCAELTQAYEPDNAAHMSPNDDRSNNTDEVDPILTPLICSPDAQDVGGLPQGGGGGVGDNGFTPFHEADSPSPMYPSPPPETIRNQGMTPINSGIQDPTRIPGPSTANPAGYVPNYSSSPTTAGLGAANMWGGGYMAQSPTYNPVAGRSPAYGNIGAPPRYGGQQARPTASYTPHSPTPYNPMMGAHTPGYQNPAAARSPQYRPTMGQTPSHTPGGYGHPTANRGQGQPDPAFTPHGGYGGGQNQYQNQPGKKDKDSSSDN